MVSIPPPQSSLAQPGATVAGKYRLESLVGCGGMGSVWSATHLGLGHQVAIKLISPQHVQSTDVRRRFDTEAKAVARLKSRHVVQIYDNGELEDGTPYIAMELLHGESLHGRIQRAGPMPLAEGVTVITQVCRALSRAHAAGIVHRDIKPDNIFLARSEEEEGYLVKVLDFGVAKLAPVDGEQSSTKTGSLVGTPLYMSPEQARGLKTIDHRTDLYSLALVAYTMLTGNLAFSGDSFGDLLLKICTEELPSLRQAAPWLPAPMDDWFKKAGARDPAARHGSAQELADSLAGAAGMALTLPVGMASNVPSSGDLSTRALSTEGAPPTEPQPLTASGDRVALPAGAPSHGGTLRGASTDTRVERPRGARALRAGIAIAAIGGAVVLLFALTRNRAGKMEQSGPAAAPPSVATAQADVPIPPTPVVPTQVATTTAPTAPVDAGRHEHVVSPPRGAASKGNAGSEKPAKPSSSAIDIGY
jgi:serine/threonine protein kinase